MQPDGVVNASAVFSGSKSLTGRRYEFRPYFKVALAGQDCVYPALGVTTSERGLYISTPIVEDEKIEPLGVVVFKMGLDKIDAILGQYEHLSMLVSPDDIIFASKEKSYRDSVRSFPASSDQNLSPAIPCAARDLLRHR